MRNQSNSAQAKSIQCGFFLVKYPLKGLGPGRHLLWFRYTRAGLYSLRSAHKAMLTGLRRTRGYYGVTESGAARLIRMRTSVDLLMEKAGGELGAVMAKKSARCTSSR